MKASKTHVYRGVTIFPVEYADKARAGYRWYTQAVHHATQLPYDSQHCPHFVTLSDAKEAIDEKLRLTVSDEEAKAMDDAAFVP